MLFTAIAMVCNTFNFSIHAFVSSYRIIKPVLNLLPKVLPYRNMSGANKIAFNFNSKHLKTGDPLPAYNGKLRVFNMRYCPYAQRTVLVLIAKNIDYDLVNVNLVDKPEWLVNKSPLGKVPALEIAEDECVIESLITSEYLDERYPQRRLLPQDPLEKAKDKILIERAGPLYTFFFKILKSPETINDEVVNNYYNFLSLLESELKSRGKTFLGGSQPGFVDYMTWPWFERVPALSEFDPRIGVDVKKYPLTGQYIENMKNDATVKKYIISNEVNIEFMTAYRKGFSNYDILNDS